ncbi:MAG: hypothetical protein A2Z34_03875 [Planctomycetes bacterium RBG_16_59_8]|nr:MAG: hypothetical protein A2Z34_03875 [Planctomycetes bacterium RBG_16_59_8]
MSRGMKISPELLEALVGLCRLALPGKAFGLISGPAPGCAEEIYPMRKNLREVSPVVNRLFEAYGEFYRDPDRGFCFDPREFAEVEGQIRRKDRRVVAVYHSHRVLPAAPTQVDRDLHYSPDLFMVIVSVADPDAPAVEVFKKEGESFVRSTLEREGCSARAR